MPTHVILSDQLMSSYDLHVLSCSDIVRGN